MAKRNKLNFFYAINLGLQLGFSIVIPLVGFLWLGSYLDKRLGSSPSFLILFLLFAFVLVFFEIRQFILPFFKKKK